METVEIVVSRRTGTGKGEARRLRGQGRVPGVLYGPKRMVAHVSTAADELERRLAPLEGSHLIRLKHADGSDDELHERMVLLRETQRHPVTGRILHADFYEVDLTERLIVAVPLHFTGKAAGVVAGGIMQPIVREVDVECLPTEIPEFIAVDVSGLGVHDAVHIADLALPEGVTAVGEPTQAIVTVLPPTVDVRPGEGAEGGEGTPSEAAASGETAAKKGQEKGSEG